MNNRTIALSLRGCDWLFPMSAPREASSGDVLIRNVLGKGSTQRASNREMEAPDFFPHSIIRVT